MKPVTGARKIVELVGAVKHITFGGELPGKQLAHEEDGFRGEAGADFRNFGRIREWPMRFRLRSGTCWTGRRMKRGRKSTLALVLSVR